MSLIMASKHTPGPWKQDAYGHIKGTDGESIRCCGVALAHRSCSETAANDRLICAAPCLLAFIESLLTLNISEHITQRAAELVKKAKN